MDFSKDEELKTHQMKVFLTHDPVGPIFDIVPWNFPFWMPFKSMILPLIAGNPILLKGAPSTPLCTQMIGQIFQDAGMDEGEFSTLFVDNDQAAKVIGDKRIRGIKFTGSTRAGKIIAANAGSHMKQCCFELGGSDPFVVLNDSDV
jgi:succinate-semialdehyde dehydrogenase/glutarate-semialdehyde dehydrogenase